MIGLNLDGAKFLFKVFYNIFLVLVIYNKIFYHLEIKVADKQDRK